MKKYFDSFRFNSSSRRSCGQDAGVSKKMQKCISRFTHAGLLLLILLLLIPAPALPVEADDPDKTLSPYFFVKSDDPEIDRLPLKSTSAQVNVAGVIADVLVTQVYENTGKRPLEAIYVFPASTRAAVYGMRMTIGDRTLVAKIKEKAEARRDYEQAKQEGKSASLLEQKRPNVFQMNVANILPGDVIKVELRYTELLAPTDGIYEFIYPTVVGPRYSMTPAAGAPDSEKWVENPYFHEGVAPPYTFDITVNLSTGLPLQKLTCSTHKTNIGYDGPAQAAVTLDKSETAGGNRDFILKYRLAGGNIESGLLLYEGKDENFFLLMVQPPRRVTPKQIPGREYIFVVDVSGSMRGFPLDISKKLLKNLIDNLRPSDRFNVLLFAGGSTVMSEQSLAATSENVNRAINVIDRQRGGGGTRLLPAMQRALALPRAEGFSRSIVVVTDGYISVEKETFDLIRNNLSDANVFAFGIGSSVNRYLIEGMARVGMGEPLVITKPAEAPAQAEKFRKYIQSPVLTQIQVDFKNFDTYDVEPPAVPDVLAERPVILFGKWRGERGGRITVSGQAAGKTYRQTFNVGTIKPSSNNEALRYLWARHRIAVLGDYNRLHSMDERVREITNLGLTYNLLTEYTSFVAVDTVVRLKDGKAVTVKQPLPLPQGVSDAAVGSGGYPSPGMAKRGRYAGKPTSMITADKLTAAAPVMTDSEPAEREESIQKDHKKERSSCLEKKIRRVTFPVAANVTTATITYNFENGKILLEKLTVSGFLSKSDIQTILLKHLDKIKDCYATSLKQNPNLKAKLVVRIRIKPDGSVESVSVISSSI